AYQNVLEVGAGGSVEEKLRLAQSIATERRLARLKVQVRERLPNVTDAQLAHMGLRWNRTDFHSFAGNGSRTIVTVAVVLQYDSSFDPKPIIAAATAILEPEVSPAVPSPTK